VWRIIVGLSLIPAIGTLYQRLTLQESTRFKKSQEAEQGDLEKEKMGAQVGVHATESESDVVEESSSGDVAKKAHFRGMVPLRSNAFLGLTNFLEVIKYFSEWRHLKILIGTCSCWFLLDVAYARCPSSNRFLSNVVVLGSTGST
jgi:PHS family inorganic phosphate transporter-like MFS transporter